MTTSIPILGIISGQTVKRLRKGAGSYISGRFVEGSETETTVQASVQMPTGQSAKAISQLPEGERIQDWIIVFSLPSTFQTSDSKLSQQSDIIEYETLRYEVKAIRKWRGVVLTHDETYALRLP